MVCGWQLRSTKKVVEVDLAARLAMAMASAAAVASSSREALAMSRPVRSQTMVWKLMRASRRPWRDFGLVGGVGGVPGGVFEDVALDDGGDDGAVVALADEGGEDLVLGGDGADGGEGLEFGLAGGTLRGAIEANLFGARWGVDQFVERIVAERVEHFELLLADWGRCGGARKWWRARWRVCGARSWGRSLLSSSCPRKRASSNH